MGRITQELLRKRAEHNDGILTTLSKKSKDKIIYKLFFHIFLKLSYLYNSN